MNAQPQLNGGGPDRNGDDLRARILAGMPVAERRLQLAGKPTVILEGGDGPPIVLLHGQGEFGAVWTRVIGDLAGTHRVIVPDLPGHGASGIGDGSLDGDAMIAWLDELIDATCDRSPVLSGHLLGGAIAARFAAARPGRVDRLVLVDTLGLSWYRPSPRFALAMVHFLARPNENTQDRLFQRCMVDLDGLRDDMDGRMGLLEAYALDRAREGTVSKALRSMMPRVGVAPIASADLERIDVPTTLIWGRHDLQVRLKLAERASERYGWPLHVIEGAADDPAVEQPAAFLNAFRSALGDDARALGGAVSFAPEGSAPTGRATHSRLP